MKTIFLYQIVDTLSEGITHTFMAASDEHATRQFEKFLESLKGKIDPKDFILVLMDGISICESFDEVMKTVDSDNWSIRGDSVVEAKSLVEVKSDES